MDWSELPNDVLEQLTSFIFSQQDYLRFSAVCRNWYPVAKQKHHSPRQLPWLVMGEDDATHKRKFFSIEENKHYLMDIPELHGQRSCGSSYGWLFILDIELNFRLLNPFTKKCYDLPDLPPYDEHHNITTYVKKINSRGGLTFQDMQLRLVSKAILDCDPSSCSDFKALIIYGGKRRLAYWSHGDSSWTLIEGVYTVIDDIIFFKKKFYAAGSLGAYHEIYVVNAGLDPKLQRVGPKVPDYDDSFPYLVDYMGQLLLVKRRRKLCKNSLWLTKKVSLKKIDIGEEKYSDYKPMDRHAIAVFMGANTSVVVDPDKYPSCKKNALYLTDVPVYPTAEFGCKDLWIFDMAECSFSKYYNSKAFIPYMASPIWLMPNLR